MQDHREACARTFAWGSGWETNADLHLVVRVHHLAFVAPRQTAMPRVCFLVHVDAPFGEVRLDDTVAARLHVSADASESDAQAADVVVRTRFGDYALVRADVRRFRPRIDDDGTTWLRLSDATSVHWRLLVSDGAFADDSPIVSARTFVPRANENAWERRMAALACVHRLAVSSENFVPHALSAALRSAPRETTRLEVYDVLSHLDDEGLRAFVAWHEFYTGANSANDRTHVLMHTLRVGGFRATERVASALESAAEEVRSRLLRARAAAAEPAAAPRGHDENTR